jgi:hypothetical protein
VSYRHFTVDDERQEKRAQEQILRYLVQTPIFGDCINFETVWSGLKEISGHWCFRGCPPGVASSTNAEIASDCRWMIGHRPEAQQI